MMTHRLATSTLLALACSAGLGLAQTTSNPFDKRSSIDGWGFWWGGVVPKITYDSTMDAKGSANSGSMKVTGEYNAAKFPHDNQISIWGSFSGTAGNFSSADAVDVSKYASLDLDMLYDTTNSPSVLRNFGTYAIGFATADPAYGHITLTNYMVTAKNTGWVHISAPIDPKTKGLDSVSGVWVQMYNDALTGTVTFWLDNIKLVAKPAETAKAK
jgi:hypothetical protein